MRTARRPNSDANRRTRAGCVYAERHNGTVSRGSVYPARTSLGAPDRRHTFRLCESGDECIFFLTIAG